MSEALGQRWREPSWANTPAMMKTAVTTPLLLDRFTRVNRRKAYANRIKPFNFLLSASVESYRLPAAKSRLEGIPLGFAILA